MCPPLSRLRSIQEVLLRRARSRLGQRYPVARVGRVKAMPRQTMNSHSSGQGRRSATVPRCATTLGVLWTGLVSGHIDACRASSISSGG